MSGNVEMVTKRRKTGGNGAIFASELLWLGVAASGYYVRTAASPSLDELTGFIGRRLAREV